MYARKEDEGKALADMRRLGLTPEDFPADADDGMGGVWPENLQAVRVFDAMGTQWRTGMGAPTGLDYSALPAVLRLVGVPRGEWSDTFDALRTLEGEAMKIMREASS